MRSLLESELGFEDSLIYIEITKEDILNKNFKIIIDVLTMLTNIKEKGMGKLLISVNGYDFDEREIYDIPEVRKYFTKLVKKYPEIFYFVKLSGEITNTFDLLMMCVHGKKLNCNQVEINLPRKVLDKYLQAILIHVDYIGQNFFEIKGLIKKLFSERVDEKWIDDLLMNLENGRKEYNKSKDI